MLDRRIVAVPRASSYARASFRAPVAASVLRDAMGAAARLLDPLAPRLCVACRRGAGRTEPLCASCRAALRWLGPEPEILVDLELWAPLAYEGPARELVRALKYRAAVRVAATMAAQIHASAPPGALERSVLVPVPLVAARRRRRGYNQTELIATQLARRSGLGLSDCLERRGRAVPQTGRGRGERALAIDGAVTVRAGVPIPVDCLLLDDVATTGATLAACAGALRAAGVRRVRAIAYARTPGR